MVKPLPPSTGSPSGPAPATDDSLFHLLAATGGGEAPGQAPPLPPAPESWLMFGDSYYNYWG